MKSETIRMIHLKAARCSAMLFSILCAVFLQLLRGQEEFALVRGGAVFKSRTVELQS
jgi:hypothetical protein